MHMDSAQKTLIEIASVSQEIVNSLVRDSGRKTVESFQLDKIVVGCSAILATLNKASLPVKGRIVDDRLKDWLSSEEPQICLGILRQMRLLLDTKLDHGIQSFFQTSHSVFGKDKNSEAIRLFQKNKACFHFLLTTEIWNCESNSQLQSSARAQPAAAMRLDEAASNQSTAQTSQNENADGSGIPQGKKTKRRKINTKKLDVILEWLGALKCGEMYESTLLSRQPDTCTWLPNTDAYKTWKSTGNSFLWLHGKPGAGKSVLAASIIEGLKSSLQDDEVSVLFYCDFRHERSTKALEVMRSLLAQLLQQLCHHTVDAEDLIEELVKEKDSATSIVSNGVLLARYVCRVANLFSRQPFIVVDALDECKDVERLLDALLELNKGGGVRLFVTSQPLLVIKTSFSYLPSISMESVKHAIFADIKLHVARELDSHRRLRILDVRLKDSVYTTLCTKADGMFRWVDCQLNVLKRCVTAVHVREALDDLPMDLNETYERILLNARKDEHEGQVVRHALDWLVAGLQPLQLSQMVEGLSIDLVRRTLDRDSGPVHGSALLDVLGSLVAYDETTDIVVLSHFTVKEYLTGRPACRSRPVYYIPQPDAHEQLALCCMCYVSIYLRQSGGQEASHPNVTSPRKPRRARGATTFYPRSRRQLSPEAHPLLDYVLSHGLCHLSYVNPGKSILTAIEALQSDAQQHPSEWERLHERKKSFSSTCAWPTLKHDIMLFILIAFAPERLLRLYIGNTQPEPKAGTNPLVYAANFKKIGHARFLLSKGVSVNLRGWHIKPDHRVLPLEVAVSRGDHRMIDLLLTESSVVPHELFRSTLKRPTNHFYNCCALSKLLQTDEFAEWATIFGGERMFLRALDPTRYLDVSEEDTETIERRLMQIGCNPSSQFNETSLRHAVSAGHVTTVKRMLSLNISLPPDIILDATSLEMIVFLLNFGSDATAVSSDGSTALHLIIGSGDDCLQKVQILIDTGCDPCASTLAGETPLHVAARTGEVSTADYLLSLGVPLPPDILLVASGASMTYFLNEGGDVHAISVNGDTVLHVALRGICHDWDSCSELANTLVDAGCNPYSRNGLGKAPFDIAAEGGHIPAMQYLLSLGIPFPRSILLSVAGSSSPLAVPTLTYPIDKGADIHATSPKGDTLLGLTVECLSRVKILIEAGCDPHACNAAGETLLHAAARKQHIQVVKYLLSLNIPVPSDILLAPFDTNTSPWGCYKMIRLLLDEVPELEVDIHAATKNGNTLLHFAAAVSTEEDALDLVKHLVDSGCNPCVSNIEQETPLHIATRYGYVSVVDYLLSLGLSLPSDILLAAAFSTKNKMIPHLLRKGANVSAVGPRGNTPLHELCTYGFEHDRLESARILLDAGCNPRSQNLFGKTPMHFAAGSGFISILEELLSRGMPLPDDILLFASAETIHFLLDRGMDVKSLAANDDGRLLYCALSEPGADEDHLERAKILIEIAGCDPSLGYFRDTPMHVAARSCRISVVEYLLSRNATLPDDILIAAVKEMQHEEDTVSLLRFLVNQGANTNATAWSGDNPLHLALHAVYHYRLETLYELVEVLLHGGSDPYARNANGKTAFDLAEERGQYFKENFLRLVEKSDTLVADLSSGDL